MFLSIIFILLAVTIHEFAHAWMAERLGDPTARLSGRLTLNPLVHLDVLGTLTLIFFGFGWGKPVPIDPYNLRSPKRDQALISLAGPVSNLLLTLVLALINRIYPLPTLILYPLAIVNLSLGLFNLLPLHPLDGSKVLIGLLPLEMAEEVEEFLERYSIPLLVAAFLPLVNGQSLINLILGPLVGTGINLLF